jgi:hypothetical protein
MAKKKAKAKRVSSAKKSVKPAKKKNTKGKAKGRKAAPKPKRQIVTKGRASDDELAVYEQHGRGARSGGQSGDTQGLSASPETDSESVEELLEEGQSFEAEVLNGIERASDADEGEVRTHEVPEDDVPEEYEEGDRD